MTPLVWQAVTLAGAALDLAAYWLATTGRTSATGRTFLRLNLVGTALLLAGAVHHGDLGFVLLNGAWLAITLSVWAKWRRKS